jgi:hypothetical protein
LCNHAGAARGASRDPRVAGRAHQRRARLGEQGHRDVHLGNASLATPNHFLPHHERMSNATEPEDDAHGLLQSLVAEVLGSEASGVVEESGQFEPGTPRGNQRCRRLRHHAWARGIITYATLVGAMVIARAVDNRELSQEILEAAWASVKAGSAATSGARSEAYRRTSRRTRTSEIENCVRTV